MNTTITKLFVYGSLRSGFRNPAYDYLTCHFQLIGEAVVKGKFFDKGDFPVAVPVSNEHFIHGELYELNQESEFVWVFGQLDDYEGVNVEPEETPLYRREPVTVYLNGTETRAWIYWYNGNTASLPELPIGDVMKYLQLKNKP